MISQNDRADLNNELKTLWCHFFQRQHILWSFVLAVKSKENEFYQEAVREAKIVKEQDYKDQGLPFPPDIYVKLAQKTPYLVERYPELMSQLALVRAFSSFEFFLKRSIRCILQIYPDRMKQDRKTSKQDGLRKQMKAVDKFTQQIAFLKGCEDGAGLYVNLCSPNFRESELYEIHQTRNIIVHNKGVVDARYLKNVTDPQFEEGDARPLSDEYLETSIHTINSAGSHLHTTFLEQFCGETWDCIQNQSEKS